MKLLSYTRKAIWTTLVLAMAIAALSGCSKDDSGAITEDYYITFDIDGNTVTFSGNKADLNVLGTFNVLEEDETDQYASGITAYSDDGDTVTILIGTFQPAETNTIYTNYTVAEPKIKAPSFGATMTQKSGTIVIGSVMEELMSPNGLVADCEIIFTEVTDTHIKGQFSGTSYDFSQNDIGNGMRINNGDFKVARLGK